MVKGFDVSCSEGGIKHGGPDCKHAAEDGACEKCYGKGYSTRLWGGGIVRGDFIGDASWRIPLQLEITPCGCKRMTRAKVIKIAKAEQSKLGIDYRPI